MNKVVVGTSAWALALASGWAALAAPAPTADVIVYGGVPCGIAASVMAAREGAKVVLIEPTKHVGGLSTSGINTAETEHMLKWTRGGFAQDFPSGPAHSNDQ